MMWALGLFSSPQLAARNPPNGERSQACHMPCRPVPSPAEPLVPRLPSRPRARLPRRCERAVRVLLFLRVQVRLVHTPHPTSVDAHQTPVSTNPPLHPIPFPF